MLKRMLSVVCPIIFILAVGAASAQTQLEVAFPSLSFQRPVDLQPPGDGSNRLFVVEQAGRIQVFENNSSVNSPKTFLDIRDRVRSVFNGGGNEMGLLGLAFHPNYASTGYFYVNYTADNPRRTVISRFSVQPGEPNAADPNSELVVLEFNQPYSNHNGGQLTFGPDGYLYIGTGDGGSGGDPQNNAQNLRTLLGAMLRIDVDHPSGGKNYGIPSDNPFVGNSRGYREEIYVYGLRNPWRFAFDAVTGWLWAADVGQNAIEEIDLIEKGKNYGWRIMEGNSCYNPPSGCDTTGLEMPIWQYNHSVGQSITGGYVYRGSRNPELVGAYIYGDYVSGRIWALRYDGSNPPQNTLLANSGLNIASFGMDAANELYLCSFDGKIYRFKTTTTGIQGNRIPPNSSRLIGNYPNPFNPETTIHFDLAAPGHVQLQIVNVQGELVQQLVDSLLLPGSHHAKWNGKSFYNAMQPSGVYFYRLVVNNEPIATKRMIFLK